VGTVTLIVDSALGLPMDEIYTGLLFAPASNVHLPLCNLLVLAAGKSRLGNLIPSERPAYRRQIGKPAILCTFAAPPNQLGRHFICSRVLDAQDALLAVT